LLTEVPNQAMGEHFRSIAHAPLPISTRTVGCI